VIKIILIIIVSVSIFGLVFFVVVRNALRRKLAILVDQEKNDTLNNSK
tara:strand:- start:556 stop:699 length:144 start_codon:yes stop_codon:yes gene_type:complete